MHFVKTSVCPNFKKTIIKNLHKSPLDKQIPYFKLQNRKQD